MAMPMTEEEKQRLLAQAARGASSQTGGGFRQAGMSSGMMSNEDMAALQAQTASMKGKENKVKSQRAYANSLRGKGAPQGKEVGPYGVYMGSNWGESLAHAGGEVLGGYLSGKADRADEALDEDRSDVALAKATEAKERQMYEDQLAADEREQQRQRRQEDVAWREKLQADTVAAREASIQAASAEKLAKKDSDIAKANMGILDDASADIEVALQRKRDMAEGAEDRRQEVVDDRQEFENDLALVEAKKDGAAPGGELIGLEDLQRQAIAGIDGVDAQKGARMMLNTNKDLTTLASEAKVALDAGYDWANPTDAALTATADFFFGETGRNMTKAAVYEETENKVRGLAANSVEAYRRARAGANLTGVEIKVGEDWDPTAPGIGAQESLRRVLALNKAVESQLDTMGIPLSAPEGGKEKTVVRTGKLPDGRKVIQYSDGSEEIQ